MKKIFFILLNLFFTFYTYAQFSEGGLPVSFSVKQVNENIDTKILESINLEKVKNEDFRNAHKKGGFRVGINIKTNFNLENSGTWTTLNNGDKIWRLKIISEGALALSLYYDKFKIPADCQVFLYNNEKTSVIGAFTELNNKANTSFATIETTGDITIIEYYKPHFVKEKAEIEISAVAHQYRLGFNGSGACQVNVNCSPEGDAWQNEKRSVLKMMYPNGEGTYYASGVLVNNVRQDYKPYFLTAAHNFILEDLVSFMPSNFFNQIRFYFNYESPSCENQLSNNTETLIGATLKTNSIDGGETSSDFAVLRLNFGDIPENYNPFFAGWDIRNTNASWGVCIHHPQGDIKKISKANNFISDTYGEITSDTHWRVTWLETQNGHGRTEGGSSGSPLFNQDKRIIGTLTGGPASCDGVIYDYYGKFSYHWQENSNQINQQAKTFLDPDNTGTLFLNGINYGEGYSVNNVELEELKIYPNPASEKIKINIEKYNITNKKVSIVIYSIIGKKFKKIDVFKGKKVLEIDINDFQNGMYLIELKEENKVIARNKLLVF